MAILNSLAYIVGMLMVLYCPAVRCAPTSEQREEQSFPVKFENLILDKIARGAAVKVGYETGNKIDFSQDTSCSTCFGSAGSTSTAPPACDGNTIAVNGPTNTGYTTCFPSIGDTLPGISIKSACNKQVQCNAVVTKIVTLPVSYAAYATPGTSNTPYLGDSYVFVNPIDGTIVVSSGAGAPPSYLPCGPGNNIMGGGALASEPVQQEYQIQCIDTNGVASNVVSLNFSLPSCSTRIGNTASSPLIICSPNTTTAAVPQPALPVG